MIAADRFKAAIAAVVDQLIPNRRFFAAVEYTLSKADGGTFSADPADPNEGYPAITDAPIRCLASANAGSKLTPGASVLVGWIAGDRTRPYLVDVLEDAIDLAIVAANGVSIDAAQVTVTGGTVDIDGALVGVTGNVTFNQGVQPVARVGDLVMGIFPITSGNPTVKA